MGISFKDVAYKYPSEKRFALKNINLEINSSGEFIFIVGPTGAGKTTLLEHFNALKIPTMGTLEILGQKIKKRMKLAKIRKKVGLVFQFPEYQLFEDTVLNDLMFGPKNFKALKQRAKELALKSAALLNIGKELLAKSPFKLSGGQMRKVAIAGVLATEPEILVLDEPTRGLDNLTAIEVMKLLLKINEEGKSIIIVSHDLNLAVKFAKRIIIINDNQIVYDDLKTNFIKLANYELYGISKPPLFIMQDELNKILGVKPNQYFLSKEEYLKYLKNE